MNESIKWKTCKLERKKVKNYKSNKLTKNRKRAMKLSSALFSQYRCILVINIFSHFSNKKKEASKSSFFISMERVTGLEPATVCLEGRNSSQLSYTRISIKVIILYFFPLFFQEKLFHLGVAGFEPATNRLWADCSNHWATHPSVTCGI